MRIIDNLIIIDLHNNKKEHLLINGLNGCVDVVPETEYKTIDYWRKTGDVNTLTPLEKKLYIYLLSHQYIMSEEEEYLTKQKIIARLSKTSVKASQLHKSACFVLSYDCNFACPYCYEKGLHTSSIITKDMVDEVLQQNPNLSDIGFFGGEPFLLSNKEIIQYIIDRKPTARFSAITNGYYLFNYLDILKKIDVSYIQVTLDGTKESHDRTRRLKNGQPTYDRIFKGITACLNHDIPITIRMNISQTNLSECLNEKLRLEDFFNNEKLSFEMQPLFQCSPVVTSELYNTLFQYDSTKTATENEILKRLMPISDFLYNGTKLCPVLKACDRDGQTRYFDPLGNIYNCILAVGKVDKSIGQYYPALSLKKKSFATRDITKIEQCQRCPNSLLCGGGCPNGLPNGSDIYSPNCANFINDIENTIPTVYRLRKKYE